MYTFTMLKSYMFPGLYSENSISLLVPFSTSVRLGMHLISGRTEFRDSVCRHRDVAHDKSVPVHRVTQYFRGRLANKGAGEQG